MRAIKLKDHDTEEELLQEIRNTKNGRYQHRLRAVLFLKRGYKAKEVQKELLISSATYCSWIKKYNEHGKDILKEHKSGRKEGNPKYDANFFKEVYEALDAMDEYWSIPKMQKLVEEKHGIKVPYETMRLRIKKAGYSYKSNRPSPYKGDKELQEEFKKTQS